jgi:hypothetical protein
MSFTKIPTIILSVKIVLTLRVKLPCRKCKILNVREIFVLSFNVSEKIEIREQFTVSAFSLTIWQTSLHILINVYWNKYGLIQTDATNDIVVYSFLAWLESIRMNSVHLPFQCSKVYRLHINYHMTKKIRIILLILDFKLGTVDKLGENSSFALFFWGIKTGIQDFLLNIYSAYKSIAWTAAIGLEVSGSNSIVSILPIY